MLWGSSRNPIIRHDLLPRSDSIFNSAVVPFGDGFAGVFRIDDPARTMNLHAGRSDDGIDWRIDHEPIAFEPEDERVREVQTGFEHAYDPRVTWLEDRYYVTWCNGYHGPTFGVGDTHDFETFHQLDNALLPFNRNGVLFPRRIGGRYAMLSRPSDSGHTPFGDMLIYHGVLTSCNGFVYSMGASLLDLDEPWNVLARSRDYLPSPQVPYGRSATSPTWSSRAPRSSTRPPTA